MEKGFTLLELLIVIAISGILASVGVVSYIGFVGSAKENCTKSQHANTLRFLQTEVLKCQTGKVTLNWLDNTGSPNPWECDPGAENDELVERFAANAVKHFKGSGFRMCFKTSDDAVVSGSSCPRDVDVGRTHINANKGDDRIDLYTRWEPAGNGCLKSSIYLE